DKPVDCLSELRTPDKVALRTTNQNDLLPRACDRLVGSFDSIHGERLLVENASGSIFDRQACDAGIESERDIDGHALGLIREAGLEITVHRQIRRPTKKPQVLQNVVSTQFAIV